ncbi:1,4-alpha-glucan branching protein GlgB [uncultured Selenomonas sp.]|uniref:1,4-alpha-glucan branching protein GlgB n=1 Tax=uncultured Selenomonas sp. TaxID=159275 RepID=UPI002804442B|nr:1,4-alpha-glucan branching protein GlgB [uncultured Selenomonas sp.]
MKTSALSEFDLYLFHQGTNYHAQEMLGAHFLERDGKRGVRFAVWAPNAKAVSVVGAFNDWNTLLNPMNRIADGEIWETFVEGLGEGEIYKYAIEPQWGGPHIMKADPYGFYAEKKPQTASRTYDMTKYEWQDGAWQEQKARETSYERPMLTYEVHAGSWRRTLEGEYLSYREMADQLIGYVKDMNYTHIEFMPLCEHPYDGSWGYQATGYFAVTSRYGMPDDFRYLVDTAHQNGIAIIMDWVPGHFCKDEQGLRRFDGKNLYESDNETRAENREWGTTNFDYGRTEVQSFLISNALFWLEEFHIDGLRIDAVANMLYLNYGRRDGEWQPNKYGDTGNLEAMDFLKKLNETIFKYHPHALMIAEESTSWPLISKPVYMGGMGFNYKWNMGWMNDMLDYVSLDPIYRKWNQDKITFSLMYAFSENFVLPLSHDEVVHGKRSLIEKMPGDYWQKFAGLRGFFGYWIAHPGKKLLFMGGEFGHFIEWNFDDSMDWHLVEQYPMHTKMLAYSKALNKFYVENTCFWQVDFDWIDCNDNENSIIALVRRADDPSDFLVCVHNFTPEVHQGYRIGVPTKGTYVEVFNSDEEAYGGSGVVNAGDLVSEDYAYHGREQSIVITVPPLASTFYRLKRQSGAGTPVSKLPEIADAVAKKKATSAQPKAAAARKKSAAADEEAKPAPKKKGAVKAKAEIAAEEKPVPKKRTAAKRSAAADTDSVPAPKKRESAKKSTAESDADEKPAPKKTRTVKAKTEESAEEKPAPKKRAAAKKPAAEKVGAQGMTAVKKKTVRKTAQGAEDAPQKARSTKG